MYRRYQTSVTDNDLIMPTEKNLVLIIDDDRILQFALRTALQKIDRETEVKCCYNGLEAIDYLENLKAEGENLPDLILLDLNMPVMNGFAFLERYKLMAPSRSQKPWLYVVTSSIDENDFARVREYNLVVDFISKPLSKEFLRNMLGSE